MPEETEDRECDATDKRNVCVTASGPEKTFLSFYLHVTSSDHINKYRLRLTQIINFFFINI